MSVTEVAPLQGCSRCETPIEDGDLRCSVCALPVPVMTRAAGSARTTIEKARSQILRCTECGAAVGFDANKQAPCCAFCGAVMRVEQPVDPIEVATKRIPFAVDRELATAALRTWLGKRGYFAPKSLHAEAVFESLNPLCWAGWVVDARALVAWTADSNEGSRRSAWAPHSGQVQMSFDNIVVPASRGLRHDECGLLVPYYDLSKVVPVDATITGEVPAMVESFDAQRSAARQLVNRAIEGLAKVRVETVVPGSRVRNIHVSCLLEGQTTDRLALPAWVLAYRYRGSPYRAVVHGQRAEIVFGTSPIDWAKVARLVGSILLGVLAIVAVIVALSGCGGDDAPLDAPQFVERCVPEQPTFAPLTGRAAVLGTLNVHVDAGGLIMVDTTSQLLLAMDLTQTGTQVAVTTEVCQITIPDVPLAGQDMPIHTEILPATIASVGTVRGTATLGSPDATCATLDSEPITVVVGARLDPAMVASAPLPTSAEDTSFPACSPSATTPCSTATGTGCACDQESDGKPGATLIVRNVPAIDLDEVYATLRTTFSLHGQVWSNDLIKGTIDAALDQGVLACKLADGTMCGPNNLRTVRALNPVVTQQPTHPSRFRAVRVTAGMTCAEIVANKATLFPR